MEVIKLSATDSTNAHLKRMMDGGTATDGTVVVAELQTAGKGQRGKTWQGQAGKNLTFSVLKEFSNMASRRHFELNMAVSMAILEVLSGLGIPGLKVKWPNDILSGGFKICGILIENTLSGTQILKTVIGIGLNVNQRDFGGLPRAASLSTVTGRSFDRETLLEELLTAISARVSSLERFRGDRLRADYEASLFGRDRAVSFASADGPAFTGIIRGVTEDGLLRVEQPEGLCRYGFGEIELLY